MILLLVTILGRRDKPLKQVVANKHKNINWRVCDVSNSEEVEHCYNNIRSEYGNINIVIANAGILLVNLFIKCRYQKITIIDGCKFNRSI